MKPLFKHFSESGYRTEHLSGGNLDPEEEYLLIRGYVLVLLKSVGRGGVGPGAGRTAMPANLPVKALKHLPCRSWEAAAHLTRVRDS